MTRNTLAALAAATITVAAFGLATGPAAATSDGCVGDPAYCGTVPPTTAPVTTAPPSTAPPTTAPVTTAPATTAPATVPASTAPSTSVAVGPPPTEAPCPPLDDEIYRGETCEIDPCITADGIISDDYVRGHVPGGIHGATGSHALHCTILRTPVPPTTTVAPAADLPETGSRTTTIAALAALVLAAGCVLVCVRPRTTTR